MIQRIQTVFLLLASVCSFGLFKMPIASTPEAVPQSAIFADAQYTVFDNPVLIGLIIAAGAVSLIAIFLFNNRKLQGSLATISTFINLAGAGFGAWFLNQGMSGLNSGMQAGIGAGLPIASIVFNFLAQYFIKKDEKLVRSMDRLR